MRQDLSKINLDLAHKSLTAKKMSDKFIYHIHDIVSRDLLIPSFSARF